MKSTLTRVQALNLTGRNIDETLAPLTAIVGPNAGGKTSIAHAIAIGLFGYVPRLGKKPSATIQLMTPGAKLLDIRLVTESGDIGRRFDVKRSVSLTSTGPDFSESIHPAQIDFEAFAQAKATDRQRILESIMTADADGDILEDARTRIATAGLTLKVLAGDGWIQTLETEAKEAARLLNQEVDAAAKTILQLQGEDPPARVNEDALAATREKLASARQTAGRKQEAFDALARKLQDAPDAPEGEPVRQENIDEAEKDLDAARKQLNELQIRRARYLSAVAESRSLTQPFAGIDPIESESEPMTDVELAEADRKIRERQSAARVAVTQAETKLDHAQAALDEARDRVKDLNQVKCCPTCGTSGTALAEAVQRIMDEDVAAKKDAALKANDALESAQKALDEADDFRKQYEASLAKSKSHRAFLAQREADRLMVDVVQVERADVEGQETIVNAIDRRLRQIRFDFNAWAELHSFQAPSQDAIDEARQAWVQAKEFVEVMADLETTQATGRAEWDRHLADQRRLAELAGENEKRTADIKALKELATWAKAKSLEVTANALKPILDVANVILDGLMVGTLAIVGTDVGVQRGDSFLDLVVLSGSEAVIVAAAIQVAIASKAEFRLVMIDELSRLSIDRKKIFLGNLKAAIDAGMVDQVIVFDHDDETGFFAGELDGQIVKIEG